MGLLQMGAMYLGFSVLHLAQLVMAVTVIGLYAPDLQRANKVGGYVDGKWAYAVVVGSIAAVTSLIYLIPFVLRIGYIWVWDTIVFILWIAAFGIFGQMYIKEDAEGDEGIERMKNAVWVLLTNALLWLISAVAMGIYWLRHREKHTRFTGRARV
ncbi:hypothetical protein B0T11DRAFT_340912 [Plectosphaerella cucumerina]|uniref:Uncharacterized protein n=1 Tax=Plectosphaerella cucumerina TaxID=40658 RepID=A0A8K0TD00_9PEZI|nr:hypothetical protein B0T11DRAFT_340912 [Plectosphaerella cucumerina]